MVIVSAKVSKRKILIGIVAAVLVILLLVVLVHKASAPDTTAETTVPTTEAGTNEERLAFLNAFGWEVRETPVETQEVRVPEEFNDVFTRYNQLQQSQGYDLTDYAGKTVKRYVYAITNHPDGGQDHYATLLVYKNKIIGGDVTCTGQGGVMQGFQMPNGA
ncbi:MAG: DUF4830 domain-containing protein [Candidatus Avoscillospira sp.]